jgi:hypothetical protein
MSDDIYLGTTGNYGNNGDWGLNAPPLSTQTGLFGSTATIKTITIPSGSQTPGGWNFTSPGFSVSVSGSVFFEGVGVQGSAAIGVSSTGTLTFQGNSDGGGAQFDAASGAAIDFSGTLGPNGDNEVNAGSIAGAGDFFLAANQELTVGSPNFSMVLQGRILGLSGSSLIKDGQGTMTLAGIDVLSGITINAGTVRLSSIGAAGGATIYSGNGPATLQIDNAAIGGGGDFNPAIHFLNTQDSLDVHLTSVPMTFLERASYNESLQTLTVDNGVNRVTFDHWIAPAGLEFVALDDHSGGTEIVPAIIESRPGKAVDAKHHPPGQPSLLNGPHCIDVRGANDTVNAPNGNDTIVVEGRGDVVHMRTGDHVVFETLKASPPSHPATLINFHHGELIDLYDLHFFVPGQHHLVFIGALPFATYHEHHPTVVGMVRYAAGVIEVNVKHSLVPSFAVKVQGAPHLHFGYLPPGEPVQDFHSEVLIY